MTRQLSAAEDRRHRRRDRPRSNAGGVPDRSRARDSPAVRLAFEGAGGIDPKELDDIINEQDLERAVVHRSAAGDELLERYYREQGYLAAEIDEPRYEFEGPPARVVLTSAKDRVSWCRNVSTSGNAVLPTSALVAGSAVSPAAIRFCRLRPRTRSSTSAICYWQRGYNDVRSDYELALDRAAGRVDVTFSVDRRTAVVIADIVVAGNEKTSDAWCASSSSSRQVSRSIWALSPSRDATSTTRAPFRSSTSPAERARRKTETAGETARAAECVGARGPAVPAALRRVVRHGARPRRHLRSLESQLARQSPRHRAPGTLRRRAARGRASLSANRRCGTCPSRSTGTVYFLEERNPPNESHAALQCRSQGRLDPAGDGAPRPRTCWSYGYRYERARTLDPEPGRDSR